MSPWTSQFIIGVFGVWLNVFGWTPVTDQPKLLSVARTLFTSFGSRAKFPIAKTWDELIGTNSRRLFVKIKLLRLLPLSPKAWELWRVTITLHTLPFGSAIPFSCEAIA